VRPHGLDEHGHAHQVDVERRQPVRALRRQPLIEIRTREIDQDVDAAEALHRERDAGRDLIILGDVGQAEFHAVSEPLGHGIAVLGVDVGDDHARARGEQRLHHGRADHGGSARDDGCLSRKSA
jgi:hypothetical protein